MSKKWFLVRAVVALIIIGLLTGLLIMGGLAIHRISWSQGYMMGQLAAGGEEGAPLPYGPPGFGYPGRHFGFAPLLFGAGLFFMLGLLLLLLVVIGKLFRFWAWRMAGGPKGEHWAKHWHRPHGPVPHRPMPHGPMPHGPMPHGPMPPWCWGWEEPSEEEAEKTEAEPDVETGAAGTES